MTTKVYLSDERFSKLLLEWDWEKNIEFGLDPNNITHGSHKKAYWVCTNDHKYMSSVHNKVKGTQCPYCCGKLAVRGVNDLETISPDLFNEVYDKDSVVELLPQSNKKVDWVCPLGHKYLSQVSRRYMGQGCPYCTNQKVLAGFNDLVTTHPKLAEELVNPEIGKTLVYGTETVVIWVCASKHRWKSSVKSRVSGTGCPRCSNTVSAPEVKLLELLKDLNPISQYKTEGFRFIPDIYIPNLNLVVEYDGSYFHRNKVERDSDNTRRLLDSGYSVCRIREGKLPFIDIEHKNLLQIPVKYTKDLSNINRELAETIISWSKHRDIIIT